MDSFYSQFILDLQAKFKAEMPVIKFIEQNLGQWADEKFTTSSFFPGMLIDFPDTTYSQLQGNDQLGTPNIEITLFFSTMSQSGSLSPNDVKQKALEYYDIEQKVVAILQGWHMDYFQPLNRISARSRNKNELGLRIRELMFSSEFEECFVVQEPREVTVTFNGQMQQTD